MNKILFSILISLVFFSNNGCAQQKKVVNANGKKERSDIGNIAEAIAFPGAEGFGKHTTGGRFGKVIIVTNLNDKGPGSFRDAVQMKVPRYIVFAVSGTIHLESKVTIMGNVTIAGQTAPGDGICIADHPVSVGGDNIIVRYMRFRLGDRSQNKGMVDGSGSDDALGGVGRSHVIIDHCSISWSTDEVFSIYGGDMVTLQWNMIYEPLNYSYHFEEGDKDFERHGYGGIWGGKHLSAHHNLFAHCNSRNPRFEGIRNYPDEFIDYRNNVIYNWGHNNVYGGEGGKYNLVNNFYRFGPETQEKVRYRIVNPSKQKTPAINYGKYYVDGNFVDGSPAVSKNNWLGVHFGEEPENKNESKVGYAFPFSIVKTHSANEAYNLVLESAGARLPFRDTLDQRIVNDVKNRTGRFIDVQGGHSHGTPYNKTMNAWPALRSQPSLPDSDLDGMPDAWERKHALNPGDPTDANTNKLDKLYTNIEVYVNSLDMRGVETNRKL